MLARDAAIDRICTCGTEERGSFLEVMECREKACEDGMSAW
jgi:hypothetical protein